MAQGVCHIDQAFHHEKIRILYDRPAPCHLSPCHALAARFPSFVGSKPLPSPASLITDSSITHFRE